MKLQIGKVTIRHLRNGLILLQLGNHYRLYIDPEEGGMYTDPSNAPLVAREKELEQAFDEVAKLLSSQKNESFTVDMISVKTTLSKRAVQRQLDVLIDSGRVKKFRSGYRWGGE